MSAIRHLAYLVVAYLGLSTMGCHPLQAGGIAQGELPITTEFIEGKSLKELVSLFGEPKVEKFVLDYNVNEFRVSLLNLFRKSQIENGDLQLLEVTFSIDDENNLTVWFHETKYVDHYIYGKYTDF